MVYNLGDSAWIWGFWMAPTAVPEEQCRGQGDRTRAPSHFTRGLWPAFILKKGFYRLETTRPDSFDTRALKITYFECCHSNSFLVFLSNKLCFQPQYNSDSVQWQLPSCSKSQKRGHEWERTHVLVWGQLVWDWPLTCENCQTHIRCSNKACLVHEWLVLGLFSTMPVTKLEMGNEQLQKVSRENRGIPDSRCST